MTYFLFFDILYMGIIKSLERGVNMYNVFEVKIVVSQIDGANSNYKDVKCSYKVFCKYEETAKRKAREQM